LNFTDLNLIDPIAKAIQEQGYTNPTPIQERSIPEIIKGKDFWVAHRQEQEKRQLLPFLSFRILLRTNFQQKY
jgi:hypothetical protein